MSTFLCRSAAKTKNVRQAHAVLKAAAPPAPSEAWMPPAKRPEILLATLKVPVAGVFFYPKPGTTEEYILATDRDGKTIAWEVTLHPQNGAQTKPLVGEVSLPAKGSVLEVSYQQEPFFFAL